MTATLSTTEQLTPRMLVGVYEAARRLSIGRSLLLEMVYSGKLPSCQIGRRRLIDERDLVAFIDSLKSA